MKQQAERQRIAAKRIETLFEQAFLRPSFAKKYVELARRIASRHKVRISQKWKSSFCGECNALLIHGKNAVVRMRKGRQVITCLSCGSVRRRMLKR
ncbi:MAG: ribonuclease P [Candidatus Woesearchaeota archaeon]